MILSVEIVNEVSLDILITLKYVSMYVYLFLQDILVPTDSFRYTYFVAMLIFLLIFSIFVVPELDATDENSKDADGSVFLKSLEGFLIVLSPEGDFVYLSENVSDYLGISQVK